MSKIIIKNETKHLTDLDAIQYVLLVMQEGKISGSENKKQYCYVTSWKSQDVLVYAYLTKQGTDCFIVCNLQETV